MLPPLHSSNLAAQIFTHVIEDDDEDENDDSVVWW